MANLLKQTMPLDAASLKSVESYKRAMKLDAAKFIANGRSKFWLYRDIVLPTAAGKQQKLPVLIALLNNNNLKSVPALKSKQPICRGVCTLLEGKVAFEPEIGVVPYGKLKLAVPKFIGKRLHVPP